MIVWDMSLSMSLIKLKYIIATGFGVGYIPVIPGTAGSLVALLIFIFLPLDHNIWLLICLILFCIGIWVSNTVETEKGKDPGIVVIDEYVGQWISLLFLPRTLWIFIAAFVLFRVLDIIKPFPAAKFEKIRGGTGIMMDDLIAGIYTNILIHLIMLLIY